MHNRLKADFGLFFVYQLTNNKLSLYFSNPLSLRLPTLTFISYTPYMNNRSVIEEIKARISIEELIGSYIKIEKSGRSLKARCPFHNEKTPSFFISPERGGYYCFGCGAKGDIFSFVEQFEGLDFKGALKVLAEKAGVQLVYEKKNDSEKDFLFEIMEEATRYFEQQFAQSLQAKEYVKKRGITDETRHSFRIGWAPDGWQNLHEHLKNKGWKDITIELAGLIKQSDRAEDYGKNSNPQPSLNNTKVRYYDRFRGRIIFPITDSSGRVVAFTGRILVDDGKSAKYLNSPETPIFIKSNILFGLDKAKTEIRRLNYSILVEGQMDLILSHQAGLKNTIAASGTALTDQVADQNGYVSNIGLVKRLSSNMIIALDSDKAGKTATMRAVVATALGLGMSIKIADATSMGIAGKDPADIILENPQNWKNVLKNAKHVIEFELNNILQEITDKHKIAKAIRDRLFLFLAKMEGEMDKSFYIKQIAEKSGISESAIWDDLKKFELNQKNDNTKNQNTPIQKNSNIVSQSKNDLVERRLFGLLDLIEKTDQDKGVVYREKIRKICGDGYQSLIDRINPNLGQIVFEAEMHYGQEPSRYISHIDELIKNFELENINNELIDSMTMLRLAEKEGRAKDAEELIKKCQVLSIRKAELQR